MAVDIENRLIDAQARNAGFLLRLTQGNTRKIGITIGMATGLQPATQFAMEHQQYAHAIGTDQPRRTG